MANEVTKSQPKMTAILASSAINQLTNSLGLTQDQVLRAKTTALQLSSSPTLNNCDPYSLIKYCFETVRYGFSREDCVYPVPYGNKVQAQIGYKGYRELAYRSGAYRDIDSVPVYDCDKLVRDRSTGKISVEFNEDVSALNDAKIIGFYAFATDINTGDVVNSVYWSKDKCESHGHQYSKTYNSVWGTEEGFSKMSLKTVIKQLCGSLKQTPELVQALKQDQIVYGGANEDDTYADNPFNDESNEVRNSLFEEE